MVLTLPLQHSIVPSTTASAQAAPAVAPMAHPAIDLDTLTLVDSAAAYERTGGPAQLWPDRTMRSVAEFLAKPAQAQGSPSQGLQEFTLCPLLLDTFDNPVVAADGFTYSLSGIKSCWRAQAEAKRPLTSPMTREPIEDFRLIPNAAMRALMEQLGLTDCHSPNPDLDEVVQWAQTRTLEEEAAPVRRTVQLDYLRDAPAALALGDQRIGGLTKALTHAAGPIGRLQVALLGLRAQAQVKTLFTASQFDHINEAAKTFRAVDVELRLGHSKKALALLTRGLTKAPDNQILLSRLALIEAKQGRIDSAKQTLARLFACPIEDVSSCLLQLTHNSPSDPHRSMWPLLATQGFMFLRSGESLEGEALLHAAAEHFPSRLLNGYRAPG